MIGRNINREYKLAKHNLKQDQDIYLVLIQSKIHPGLIDQEAEETINDDRESDIW